MSNKNEKLHRKISLITFGTSQFAGKLKPRWDRLTHREKGKVRKQLKKSIGAWERAQLELAIEKGIDHEHQPKKF